MPHACVSMLVLDRTRFGEHDAAQQAESLRDNGVTWAFGILATKNLSVRGNRELALVGWQSEVTASLRCHEFEVTSAIKTAPADGR